MQNDKDTREPENWAQTSKSAPPPRNAAPGLWLFTLLLTALVIVPILISFVPREIGRWYMAAALEERLGDKKVQAYATLDTAIRWDKGEPAFFLQRASWRQEDGEYQTALDDCNHAIELSGSHGENYATLAVRSQIYQHLGRHGAAIADWQKIDRVSTTSGTPERAVALNGLAYARAVGNLELKEGLANVDEALKLEPGSAAILDTRGFLRYLTGDYEGALEDLDKAVQGIERLYGMIDKSLSENPPTELDKRLLTPDGQQALQSEQGKQSVAVIRYHRALVYDKLDRAEEAKKDRARAKELIGREPDEKLF